MAQVLKLKILTGKHSGREIEIDRSKFVIGRADDCDLRPASPAVSRRHCAFVAVANGFKLQDLGGANGTLVNDVRIQGEQDLTSGDRIKVGPLEFQVSIAAAAPAAESGSSSDTKTSDMKTSAASQSGTQPDAKTRESAPKDASGAPLAKSAGEAPPANSDGADDDVMQWLTDAPAKGPKSIYIEIDTSQPNPAALDTAQISLDGTQPFVWPGSPAPAPTIVPTPSVSELIKSSKSGSKLADPNDAGNTRDAANAAIEMFRHRKDK